MPPLFSSDEARVGLRPQGNGQRVHADALALEIEKSERCCATAISGNFGRSRRALFVRSGVEPEMLVSAPDPSFATCPNRMTCTFLSSVANILHDWVPNQCNRCRTLTSIASTVRSMGMKNASEQPRQPNS